MHPIGTFIKSELTDRFYIIVGYIGVEYLVCRYFSTCDKFGHVFTFNQTTPYVVVDAPTQNLPRELRLRGSDHS
jgi:hypothetical protein